MSDFSFQVIAKDKNSKARAGIIHTKHGKILTPYLVTVATRAHVIAVTPKDIKKIKIQAMLANTYHLHMLKLDKKIKSQGGLAKFMKFNNPTLTDSGGFQAFSLGWGRVHNSSKIGFIPNKNNIRKNESQDKNDRLAIITPSGVKFKSVYDDKWHFIGPKESMQIQSDLGADIIMAFDECTSPFSNKEYTSRSLEKTHKWERLSLKYKDKKQALYGIIQGGEHRDLRIKSTKYINSLPFEGIAIGGSFGKAKKRLYRILDWTVPLLDSRPRHLLGIGWIEDIFECVERGIDTFDCVETTRVARHGNLFISPQSGGKKENKFKLKINRSIYEKDKKPIDKKCKCYTCKHYSRAKLRALFKSKNPEYKRLATIHNLSFMHNLCLTIRRAIIANKFKQLKRKWIR